MTRPHHRRRRKDTRLFGWETLETRNLLSATPHCIDLHHVETDQVDVHSGEEYHRLDHEDHDHEDHDHEDHDHEDHDHEDHDHEDHDHEDHDHEDHDHEDHDHEDHDHEDHDHEDHDHEDHDHVDHDHVDHDHELRYSSTGLPYFIDVFLDHDSHESSSSETSHHESAAGQTSNNASEAPGPPDGGVKVPLSAIPSYNSFPGAANSLYIDFNGAIVSGTDWNVDYDNKPIHARPFDKDGDTTTFSEAELDIIFEVWQRVSEDYLPFDINVTTVEPPEVLPLGHQSARTIVTHSEDDAEQGGTGEVWFPGVGGVAYVGGWITNREAPAWVFHNAVPNTAKGIAEATAHEFGHIVGLSHHGVGDSEYYDGHGEGDTSWAPIMGAGYRQAITQWSKGTYAGATNAQNDLEIITNRFNRINFREDDHDETVITPDENGRLFVTGIIETRRDYDLFRFEHPGGPVSFKASPAAVGGNLDILAVLYDGDLDVIFEYESLDSTSLVIAETLDAGTYVLEIDGGSHFPVGEEGYSDYGSLGAYTVEGSLGVDVVIADAGNNYTIDEGESMILDATQSFGISGASTFRWDLNNDGAFDDAEGQYVELSWEQLAALESPITDDGIYRISVEVTNGLNSDVAGATVTILNKPPTVKTTDVSGYVNQLLWLSLTVEDVASDSTLIEWEFGDMTNNQINVQQTATHIYTSPGEYTVSVSVGDDDGGVTDTSFVVTIRAPLPGDADYDGQVAFADFLILSANFGQSDVGWSQGDFDEDGIAGFADFLLLSANFGKSDR